MPSTSTVTASPSGSLVIKAFDAGTISAGAAFNFRPPVYSNNIVLTTSKVTLNDSGYYKVVVRTPTFSIGDSYAVFMNNQSVAGFTLDCPGNNLFRGILHVQTTASFLTLVNRSVSTKSTADGDGVYFEVVKIN